MSEWGGVRTWCQSGVVSGHGVVCYRDIVSECGVVLGHDQAFSLKFPVLVLHNFF